MKRISAIIKGGITEEVTKRKAKRVLRQVEQMADYADDKASEAEERADDIINSLGDCATAEQTEELQNTLNRYNEAIEEAEVARKTAQNFRKLLEKLNEDVKPVKE